MRNRFWDVPTLQHIYIYIYIYICIYIYIYIYIITFNNAHTHTHIYKHHISKGEVMQDHCKIMSHHKSWIFKEKSLGPLSPWSSGRAGRLAWDHLALKLQGGFRVGQGAKEWTTTTWTSWTIATWLTFTQVYTSFHQASHLLLDFRRCCLVPSWWHWRLGWITGLFPMFVRFVYVNFEQFPVKEKNVHVCLFFIFFRHKN